MGFYSMWGRKMSIKRLRRLVGRSHVGGQEVVFRQVMFHNKGGGGACRKSSPYRED